MPDRGTRERTNMRLNLLDKAITVNLLYLDALSRGLDKNPVFQADEERYADQTLASMYRQKYLIGQLPVSDDEIRDFFKKNYPADTPYTQDIHMAIESVSRMERYVITSYSIHYTKLYDCLLTLAVGAVAVCWPQHTELQCLAWPRRVVAVSLLWYRGLWDGGVLAFALQMCLVLLTGYG